MRIVLRLVLLFVFPLAKASDVVDTNHLTQDILPRISNDTLIIEGHIGSHIYDFLVRERAALKSVKTVELNSFGGEVEWALLIATYLKLLGLDTVLSKDHVCMSSCVFIFASGRDRIADEGTWFGIHGVRIKHFAREYERKCVSIPKALQCAQIEADWYKSSLRETESAFLFLETNGVSINLRKHYLDMPDESAWIENGNGLKKPDWDLPAEDAIKYGLVSKIRF